MHHLNLNAADLFWVCFAISWIVFSVVVLIRYCEYYRAAQDIEQIELRLLGISISWDFLRAESFRLASHMISVGLGLIVIFTVPQPDHHPTRLSGIISFGLILLNLFSGINSINAFFSFNRRSQIIEQIGAARIDALINEFKNKGATNVHTEQRPEDNGNWQA